MIGDKQGMLAPPVSTGAGADANDPCRRGEKAWRPAGATEKELGCDMDRRDRRKQEQKPRYAQGASGVQSNSLSGGD